MAQHPPPLRMNVVVRVGTNLFCVQPARVTPSLRGSLTHCLDRSLAASILACDGAATQHELQNYGGVEARKNIWNLVPLHRHASFSRSCDLFFLEVAGWPRERKS